MTTDNLTDEDRALVRKALGRYLGDGGSFLEAGDIAALLEAVRQEERSRYQTLFDAAWEYLAAEVEPARKVERVRPAADRLRAILASAFAPPMNEGKQEDSSSRADSAARRPSDVCDPPAQSLDGGAQ